MDVLKRFTKYGSILVFALLCLGQALPALAQKECKIEEIYVNDSRPEANVDSCASWQSGDRNWLIATGKETDELIVYDALTGRIVKTVGEDGEKLGQFERPNGIAVIDDLVFVVERDNRRIQVMSLPGFEPLGTFGSDILKKPYGIYIHSLNGNKRYEMFVTDDYSTQAAGTPPLYERVKRFEVKMHAKPGKAKKDLSHAFKGTFGDISGPGALNTVESIWGQPKNNRLMIADEKDKEILVYTMDGKFTGKVLGNGRFQSDPEGIGLIETPQGEDCWVFTDQRPRHTGFMLFGSKDLSYKGICFGKRTGNTDGIWVHNGQIGNYSQGLLFAVEDDRGVAAFPVSELLQNLEILKSQQ